MTAVKRETTAAEALLLAAASLGEEFTEWELTVAAWKADPQRFGMKGFASRHPDHKRVYCELVKQPERTRWCERVRPSVWRITRSGELALQRMKEGRRMFVPPKPCPVETLVKCLNQPAYLMWLADPAMPDDAGSVRQFEAYAKFSRKELAARIEDLSPDAKPAFAHLADFLTAMNYRFGEG